MARKIAPPPAATAILVAAITLKGGGTTIEAGTELTADLLQELGFDKKTKEVDGPAELARLKDRGFVKEVTVRSAEPGPEAAALKAANDRAEAAEARAADLAKQVESLTADLAAAKKPA